MQFEPAMSLKAHIQSGAFISAPGVFDLISARMADRKWDFRRCT